MNQWLYVLIDIGVLGFFALLYYIYQKRRIIYYSEVEFRLELESLIDNLHYYLEENKDHNQFTQINQFVSQLEKYLEKNPEEISELTITPPQELPQHFKEHFEHITNMLIK
jgi:O6-methylguanine-DNA--protein-cysteine methyltransferase